VISTGEWERALGCIPPQSSRRTAASLPVAFGLARSFSLACFSSRSQRTAAARYLSHSLPSHRNNIIINNERWSIQRVGRGDLDSSSRAHVVDRWLGAHLYGTRALVVCGRLERACSRSSTTALLTNGVVRTSVSIGVGVWRRHFRSRRTCKTATFESCLAPRSRYEVCVHTSRERGRDRCRRYFGPIPARRRRSAIAYA